MERIKINGHEVQGNTVQEIAEKILQQRTTYDNLPWMQQLRLDLEKKVAAGEHADRALLELIKGTENPYHFSFLKSRKLDEKELLRLFTIIDD